MGTSSGIIVRLAQRAAEVLRQYMSDDPGIVLVKIVRKVYLNLSIDI